MSGLHVFQCTLHWDVNLSLDNRNNVAVEFRSSFHVIFLYFYIHMETVFQYPITEESNDVQKALISCRRRHRQFNFN